MLHLLFYLFFFCMILFLLSFFFVIIINIHYNHITCTSEQSNNEIRSMLRQCLCFAQFVHSHGSRNGSQCLHILDSERYSISNVKSSTSNHQCAINGIKSRLLLEKLFVAIVTELKCKPSRYVYLKLTRKVQLCSTIRKQQYFYSEMYAVVCYNYYCAVCIFLRQNSTYIQRTGICIE